MSTENIYEMYNRLAAEGAFTHCGTRGKDVPEKGGRWGFSLVYDCDDCKAETAGLGGAE